MIKGDDLLVHPSYVLRLCSIALLHPNVITLVGIACSAVVLVLVQRAMSVYVVGTVCVLLVFRAYLDCLDGAVARTCDKKTLLGAWLDTVADVVHWLVVIYMFTYVATRSARKASTAAVTLVLVFFVSAYLLTGSTRFIVDHNVIKSPDARHESSLIHQSAAFAYNNVVTLNIVVCAAFVFMVVFVV
jgi:phosphatidylglycerophosphate synthase